ncbi:MAG: FecR domain-containing protein [Gammaproteobacteria bacterium]|nr:FecR domain-containing protein [Gammaproteobacteria bacterium]
MNDLIKTRDVTEQAAEWIARLDAGELSSDDLMRLREWAIGRPAHIRELERLADIWGNLDLLSPLKTVIAKPRARPHARLVPLALAAGLAAISIVLWFLVSSSGSINEGPIQSTYATKVGEQISFDPGEGSTINLNTDSRLSVKYTQDRRIVKLDRGEAYFDIASADPRPFVVQTEHGDVVVTGTSFLVRVDETSLEVLVEEGQVEVHSVDGAGADMMTAVTALSAGEVATISDLSRRVDIVETQQMHRKLDWRDGMLTFDGETLEEVVNEISRYTSTSIVIDDPNLRTQRFGGQFQAGAVDDLLVTLQNSFDIQVNRVGDTEIRLARQEN